MYSYNAFLKRLRATMENVGLSVKDMACGLNVSPQTVRRFLSGKTKLRARRFMEICEILGVKPAYLLEFDDDEPQN